MKCTEGSVIQNAQFCFCFFIVIDIIEGAIFLAFHFDILMIKLLTSCKHTMEVPCTRGIRKRQSGLTTLLRQNSLEKNHFGKSKYSCFPITGMRFFSLFLNSDFLCPPSETKSDSIFSTCKDILLFGLLL